MKLQTIDLEHLRKLLEEFNLKKVAEACGIHPNALYRLMKGEVIPRYNTIVKIVEYLQTKREKTEE